jgi:hypothetical protein
MACYKQLITEMVKAKEFELPIWRNTKLKSTNAMINLGFFLFSNDLLVPMDDV